MEEGWVMAPGDSDDLKVCGAHPWQSDFVAFADGYTAGIAIVEESHLHHNYKGGVCIALELLVIVLGKTALRILYFFVLHHPISLTTPQG
jgi:hypothetical protein